MQKVKRAISTILAVVFVLMVSTSYLPVNAAPKAVKPQVKLNAVPLKQYSVGDKVNVKVSAPNYSGKVQYRVMLINVKGGYKELYSTSDHYSKPIGSGKTILPISFPTTQEGTYILQILVKRNATKVTYDTLVKTISFTVATNGAVYSKEGATYKYPETANITVDSKITAKNITVDNANFAKSLYVSANNATLKNINVKGTLFVDPGKDGVANLENVTANEIKVLSGAENSIHLKNVNSNKLLVSSDSKVRVEATGTTKIGNTEVTSYAVIDSKSGSLGTITVSKSSSGKFDVEFSGTYTEPIVVETEANIKATAGANIPKLEVAPTNNEQVKLEGEFKSVEVTKEAKLDIAADAKITESVKVTAKAEIKADTKSQVSKVDVAPQNGEAVKLDGTFKSVEVNKQAKVELAANTSVRDTIKVAAAVELVAPQSSKVAKVEVAVQTANANVKIDGVGIGLVDVKSATKIEVTKDTKTNIVVNTKGAEVSVPKGAQIALDTKTSDVKTSGDGNAAKTDLSKLENATNSTIEANMLADKVAAEKAAAEAAAKAAAEAAAKATTEAEKKAAEEAAKKAESDRLAAEAAAKKAEADRLAAEAAAKAAAEAAAKEAEKAAQQPQTPPITPGGGDPTPTPVENANLNSWISQVKAAVMIFGVLNSNIVVSSTNNPTTISVSDSLKSLELNEILMKTVERIAVRNWDDPVKALENYISGVQVVQGSSTVTLNNYIATQLAGKAHSATAIQYFQGLSSTNDTTRQSNFNALKAVINEKSDSYNELRDTLREVISFSTNVNIPNAKIEGLTLKTIVVTKGSSTSTITAGSVKSIDTFKTELGITGTVTLNSLNGATITFTFQGASGTNYNYVLKLQS